MLSVKDWSLAGSEVSNFIVKCSCAPLERFDIGEFIRLMLARTEFLDSAGNLISETARIEAGAIVKNSWVMDDVNVHEGVSIRDSIIMSGARVGHAGEIARSIIGPRVSLPRFNYVGASIVGADVRFGGCVSLATRRYDDQDVTLFSQGRRIPTGRVKFGSIIGEKTIIGYGVHINPGVSIGRRCIISPLLDIRVSIPDDKIVIGDQKIRLRDNPER